MSLPTQQIPPRVLAIAAAIVVLLVVAGVWLARSGDPIGDPSTAGLGVPDESATDPEGPDTPDPGMTDAAGGDTREAATTDALVDGTGGATGVEDSSAAPGGDDPFSTDAIAANAEFEGIDTESVTIRLFLIEPSTLRLSPVIRRREAPMTLPAQAQIAVDMLRGSAGGAMVWPLPREAEVREVWVSPGGIAYVDFSGAILDALPGGSLAEIHAVYGVIATLTASFPNIHAVQFLVEGREIDTLNGHLNLSRPLLPLSDWMY